MELSRGHSRTFVFYKVWSVMVILIHCWTFRPLSSSKRSLKIGSDLVKLLPKFYSTLFLRHMVEEGTRQQCVWLASLWNSQSVRRYEISVKKYEVTRQGWGQHPRSSSRSFLFNEVYVYKPKENPTSPKKQSSCSFLNTVFPFSLDRATEAFSIIWSVTVYKPKHLRGFSVLFKLHKVS